MLDKSINEISKRSAFKVLLAFLLLPLVLGFKRDGLSWQSRQKQPGPLEKKDVGSSNQPYVMPHSLSSVQDIRTVITAEVKDLNQRIDEAFEKKESGPPGEVCRFSLNSLLSEMKQGGGSTQDALCEALARDYYVVVSLDEGEQQTIEAMWSSLESFFNLELSVKQQKAGEFQNVDGAVGIVGYNLMPDGNEFLETRVWPNGTLCPTLNSAVNGFDTSILAARSCLSQVGIVVVSAALNSLGVTYDSIADLIDDGQKENENTLESPFLSATQHRFCRYTSKQAISFGAHTDTTFATIIPCSSIAGLEVYTETEGWVRPEMKCLSNEDVLVLSGELLQIFTAQRFPAAVHRVLKNQEAVGSNSSAVPPRMSAPLLLRPQPSKKLDAKVWLQDQDDNPLPLTTMPALDASIKTRFKMLDKTSMGELHQYLVDAFRSI